MPIKDTDKPPPTPSRPGKGTIPTGGRQGDGAHLGRSPFRILEHCLNSQLPRGTREPPGPAAPSTCPAVPTLGLSASPKASGVDWAFLKTRAQQATPRGGMGSGLSGVERPPQAFLSHLWTSRVLAHPVLSPNLCVSYVLKICPAHMAKVVSADFTGSNRTIRVGKPSPCAHTGKRGFIPTSLHTQK